MCAHTHPVNTIDSNRNGLSCGGVSGDSGSGGCNRCIGAGGGSRG